VKLCSWCDNSFKPSVSYQIYCSSNCRDEATKTKIVARYAVIKRQKRKNKKRYCASGCGVSLSIYNDDTLCNSCNVNNKDVNKILKQIKGIANDSKNNQDK
jgi:hypothetical protein